MTKKIYISGKITGIETEAAELFAKAETWLRAFGYETVNPLTLNHNHDKSWHSYMKEDIKALCDCDEIFMLSNWADSKGAIIEHTIAMYLGLKVRYKEKATKPTKEQREVFGDGRNYKCVCTTNYGVEMDGKCAMCRGVK